MARYTIYVLYGGVGADPRPLFPRMRGGGPTLFFSLPRIVAGFCEDREGGVAARHRGRVAQPLQIAALDWMLTQVLVARLLRGADPILQRVKLIRHCIADRQSLGTE